MVHLIVQKQLKANSNRFLKDVMQMLLEKLHE